MKININEEFSAQLTVTGAEIWNQSFEVVPEKYRPERKAAGDTIHTQLWALMQAFGPHVFMGMAQPHFVDNIIEKK